MIVGLLRPECCPATRTAKPGAPLSNGCEHLTWKGGADCVGKLSSRKNQWSLNKLDKKVICLGGIVVVDQLQRCLLCCFKLLRGNKSGAFPELLIFK